MSRDEAASIPGVGQKMADKVMEIVESGSLQKVDEVCNSEKMRTIDLFTRVWGAGPTAAGNWYEQGCRTLEDLNEKAHLTRQQKVGLRLFHDLDERMSRQEAGEIETFVRETAHKIKDGKFVRHFNSTVSHVDKIVTTCACIIFFCRSRSDSLRLLSTWQGHVRRP